jgi:diacylglycerol kinase family enzyme
MDLGRANDDCFLLMAGIGWDAEVTAKVSKRLKRAVGDLAYIAQGAWMAPRMRTKPARWTTLGKETEAPLAWMLLGNTRLYGGKIQLTNEAVLDDGLLDVMAMCPQGVVDTGRIAAKLVAGKRHDRTIEAFRCASLTFQTPGLALQLDGDYAGETPVTFRVEPRALLVSVPAGRLAPIFGAPHMDRRKP